MGVTFIVTPGMAVSTFRQIAIFIILPSSHDFKKLPGKNQVMRASLYCVNGLKTFIELSFFFLYGSLGLISLTLAVLQFQTGYSGTVQGLF